jgi:hypothetical protein
VETIEEEIFGIDCINLEKIKTFLIFDNDSHQL